MPRKIVSWISSPGRPLRKSAGSVYRSQAFIDILADLELKTGLASSELEGRKIHLDYVHVSVLPVRCIKSVE